MADQGFKNERQLSEDVSRPKVRYAPIKARTLTATSVAVLTVPEQQQARVAQLAVCNPTAASVTLAITTTPKGGTALAQISALSVAAGATVNLTAQIGGLYGAGDLLSAAGVGLVLSGYVEIYL